MVKIPKSIYFFINALCIIALLVLHFLIKDRTFNIATYVNGRMYDTSLLFYLFPLPIIVLIILLLSIPLKKKRKYNVMLAGILLCVWFARSFRLSFSQDTQESDLEVVFWNASRDNNFEDAIMEHKSIPDVMVLSEAIEPHFNELKLKHPNLHIYKSSGELEIYSKTPLIIINENSSKNKSNIVHFKTAGMDFYATDVTGRLDIPRLWEANFINSTIKKKKNTVVLGDFNAPYESLFLDDLKKNYTHFFSSKSNGFRETWFWNMPLLSLDHIWVSKDLEIIKSEKIRTHNSDHSMIKTVIRK